MNREEKLQKDIQVLVDAYFDKVRVPPKIRLEEYQVYVEKGHYFKGDDIQ